MKLLLFTILIGLEAGAAAQAVETAGTIAVSAEDEMLECPTSAVKDKIEEWRSKAISIYTKGQYQKVATAIDKCFTSKVPLCLNELADEVDLSRNNRSYYDKDHLPRAEQMIVKSEKDLPKEFLDGGFFSTNEGYVKMPKDILTLAKEKGWEALLYKTRSTGGFDDPPNLLMVVIPGRDKDIYIQTSPHGAPQDQNNPVPQLTKDELANGQSTMTIITVDKTVNPPIGQLRLLNKEGYGKDAPYKWTNRLTTESCLKCHSTPLRSISPIGYKVVNGAEKRMSAEDEATTTRINEMMVIKDLSWGRVKTEDGKVLKLGPDQKLRPLGWLPAGSEDRSEDELKLCATTNKKINFAAFGSYRYDAIMSANPTINFSKVKHSMDCAMCHNGSIRGSLNQNFSDQEIRFKILVDRSMPPGADLTDDERIALYNCLNIERTNSKIDKAWKENGEWLKREACADVPTRRTNRMNLERPGTGSGTGR